MLECGLGDLRLVDSAAIPQLETDAVAALRRKDIFHG
jgi:hypothetical protein